MWVFRTIVLVPRPTQFAVFPNLVLLLSYLALVGRDGMFLGQPLVPLTIAMAAGLIARQFGCTSSQVPLSTGTAAAQVGACGIAVALLLMFAPVPQLVQGAYSVALMAWAFTILGVIWFTPALASRLPSIWAGQGDGSPGAMSLVAGSFVLRALGAWLLMLSGDHLIWILFVSLGGLAIEFLTNWVILLYLYLHRVNN